ncbi:MAG: hypothetical protein HZA02_02250 [Nitrospinae bacterium]|nr:hypothetical protein [Nitrospinota bacterium]
MANGLNVEYTVQIWKEGDRFVAHAMPLDIMSCGETPEQAGKALDEAVRLFLATASEMGTLDEVLEEAGYEHCGQNWRGPSWVSFERHSAAIGT